MPSCLLLSSHMHPEFWHRRWADNQIGFHESKVNPLLAAHFDVLDLQPGARVLLPLCGKTVDIDWLLEKGFRVAAAELSPLAVLQLFERLRVAPRIERLVGLDRYSAPGLDVFLGDFFRLSAGMLGAVSGVYDRAALIALPAPMRKRYVEHLRSLTGDAAQLLITLDYDQRIADGPPFSVPAPEVREHYGNGVALLSSQLLPEGLKGRYPVTECAWKVGQAT